MGIQAECDGCGRVLRVKDDAAGRRIKCPDCGEPVNVPSAGREDRQRPQQRRKAAKRLPQPADEGPPDADDIDFAALASMANRSQSLGSGELKPCPACGEEIGSDVSECPFCEEDLDGLRRKERKAKSRKASEELASARAKPVHDDEGWDPTTIVVFILIF